MALVTSSGRFGESNAPVTLTISEWEYTRVAFGRRSVSQVVAMDWSGTKDPTPYAPLLSRFGLATADLTD
jgi:hypothetical protein